MATREQKQAQQAEHEGDSMTTAESAQRGQESTTEQIVRELRRSGPLGPTVNGLMLAAASRLEQQEWELVESAKERNKTVANLIDQRDAACGQLKQAVRNGQLVATCPEPSRLEIAAMAMQGFISTFGFAIDIPKNSLDYADALIAAAKQ